MRSSRSTVSHSQRTSPRLLSHFDLRRLMVAGLFLAALLGGFSGSSATFAARQPTGTGTAPEVPSVTGADYTFHAAAFSQEKSESREKSLSDNLTIPDGRNEATYTSGTTRAPLDFTDIGPRWWADTPDGTSVNVEVRTSKDGSSWAGWQPVDLEDIASAEDVVTQTYASLISVNQTDRVHRFVQSRIILRTVTPGVTPVFHELTYTFINAGVTGYQPKPQAMAMGTPSDAPRPVLVSRNAWGSPEGESSPTWAPRYRRVTHLVVHHTATPNEDGDFAARVRAIWYFHAKTRGWGDIGYNYVIDPNGVIYEGRAGGDDVEAGHAYPFNSGSMGIGMLGNFMTVPPTAAAQAALIDLLSWKVNQRGINPLGVEPLTGYTNCGGTLTYTRPTIAGHRDYRGTACGRAFNNSTCPGDRLWGMLPQIRKAVVAEQPALRASFTAHDTPGNLPGAAGLDVHVSVRNTGSLTWSARGQGAVSLGYRWLGPDGKPLQSGPKPASASLTKDLPFADSVKLTIRLNTPVQAGHYAVVFDMYRDGQGWFADQGSRPLRVDVVVGKSAGDQTPPESEVLPLPVYSNIPVVTVRWSGKDDAKGSGIVSYDIQFRMLPQGAWTDWKQATSETQASFEGQDGYTYAFRSRARDAAGNVEAWRDDPDAYTTIDTQPPTLAVDTPTNGSHVNPGNLLVRGRAEQGAFVAVNDQRAEVVAGVFTSTVQASGRDFVIQVTAADPAGNVARLEIIVQAAPRYNDVPMDHPDFIAIEYLSDQQVVSGYGDGSFRPDTPVTRAQVAKTLAAALHWGLIKPLEPRFSDVDPSAWPYPYVETAAARKVLDGYSDGTFRPNGGISRSLAIKAVVRAAAWTPVRAPTSHFLDVSPRSELSPFVEAAYIHGAVVPDAEGYFYPNANATRGALSHWVYAVMQSLIEEMPPNPGDDQGPDQFPAHP